MKLYWKGFLAEYTGRTTIVAGGTFYEIRILEGHLKGTFKVTSRPPKEQAGWD